MKRFKLVLVAIVLFANLFFAQPSWADAGKFIKSQDYADVTQAIDRLVNAKDNPGDLNLSSEQLQLKLSALQLQKYILESAEERAQCTNNTGRTIGIYAKSKKAPASAPSTLYYLGAGETTDDDFDCDGIYLPSGANVTLSPLAAAQELTEPIAVRVVDGTRLAISSNPQTGAIELNVPPAQVVTTGENNWAIPALTQADIDAQKPNAPQD